MFKQKYQKSEAILRWATLVHTLLGPDTKIKITMQVVNIARCKSVFVQLGAVQTHTTYSSAAGIAALSSLRLL